MKTIFEELSADEITNVSGAMGRVAIGTVIMVPEFTTNHPGPMLDGYSEGGD